jgi:hypothetical protein
MNPNSDMATMFDFSAMKNPVETKTVSDQLTKPKDDDVSQLTGMFSVQTNFSKFFHPNGREKTATDRCQEWHKAGNPGKPLEWMEEELHKKDAARAIFEEGVKQNANVQVQAQVEQQLKHQAKEHQAQQVEAKAQIDSLQVQLDQLLCALPQGLQVTWG